MLRVMLIALLLTGCYADEIKSLNRDTEYLDAEIKRLKEEVKLIQSDGYIQRLCTWYAHQNPQYNFVRPGWSGQHGFLCYVSTSGSASDASEIPAQKIELLYYKTNCKKECVQ